MQNIYSIETKCLALKYLLIIKNLFIYIIYKNIMPSPKKTSKKTTKKNKRPKHKIGDTLYYDNRIYTIHDITHNDNDVYVYTMYENGEYAGEAFAKNVDEGYEISVMNRADPSIMLMRFHESSKKTDSGGGNRKTKRKLNKRKSNKNKKTLRRH